jgi:hypothetical protein
MNKNGNTQVGSSAMAEKRGTLRTALTEMDERQVVSFFREFTTLKARLGKRPLENAAYTLNALDMLRLRLVQALKDRLDEKGAALVEDLYQLMMWMAEVERGGGKVGWHVNIMLIDTVLDTEHNLQDSC